VKTKVKLSFPRFASVDWQQMTFSGEQNGHWRRSVERVLEIKELRQNRVTSVRLWRGWGDVQQHS